MISPNPLPRATPRQRPIAFATLAALLFVLPVAAGCSKNSSSEAPAGPDPVIARVNGVEIKQSDLALAEEDVGADMQAASPEAKREHLISYLADIIMVTQAADKKKLADKVEARKCLEMLLTAARDATNVVNRLREFYRPIATDEEFPIVDLAKIVKQAISLTEPMRRPPTCTSSPFTSCPAFSKISVYSCPPPRSSSSTGSVASATVTRMTTP